MERLFADGQLGASFFCSKGSGDRGKVQLIFPTLAAQLARKYIKIRKILIPLMHSHSYIAYQPLCVQMRNLIVLPLKQSDISTVIVIDALDECEGEEPASAILPLLRLFAPEIPKVKFLLTSRPEPHISDAFNRLLLAKTAEVFFLHNVEPSQVNSDIRLFFRTKFLELPSRDRLGNWPAEDQLDHLCMRAAGLFAYAASVVKFIDDSGGDPRKQLDLLLRSRKIGSHEGKTLDKMYELTLQGAFCENGPMDDAGIRSVLGTVVVALYPLSPSAIAMLLGFDITHALFPLSSINSLLILEEDVSRPVRPFHKSFPDFITDRCTNPRFRIFPPVHHLQLVIGCLGLMNQMLAKNMCKLPDAAANSDVSDLEERTKKYIGPALRYACLSWHKHLVNGTTGPADAPAVTLALHQFLEEKFLFWLEVLSVLGAARDIVEALESITHWSEVCRVSTLDVLPTFTQTGSRSHQCLTSQMTAFISWPNTSSSLAHPLRISTRHSLFLPWNHRLRWLR